MPAVILCNLVGTWAAAYIALGLVVPPTEPFPADPRALLWRSCEHEAAERYVAGADPDRPDWLRLGAAECVSRRGYPAEAERGPYASDWTE
jgi:hypothetical protein